MKKTVFFFLASATLLIYSCETNHYKEEVKDLEKLIKQVEKSSTKLVQIDTTGLADKWQEYKDNVNTITDTYKENGDTIGRELAMILSDYKQLKKPYSEFKDAYSTAMEELKFTKNQLVTLKHDLENNKLEPPVAEKMIQSEKMAARKIMEHVEQLARTDSVTQVKAVEINATIDSVITSLSTSQ
jgi:chromosome segregation ATPase